MLLFVWIGVACAAICHPLFGGVTRDDIARAEADAARLLSPAYHFGAHPFLVAHTPYARFDDLARLPLLRAADARVVIADYALLRRDFPSLTLQKEEAIDAWLLEHGAWVHAGCSRLVTLHTRAGPAPNASRWSAVSRRSFLLQADGGLLDAKGSCCAHPRAHVAHGDHADCLCLVVDRVIEFVTQKMVNALLLKAGRPERTLGHYAVLDYGFLVPQRDGRLHRAGASLRQAHSRHLLPFTFLEPDVQVALEMTLRAGGFASVPRAKMAAVARTYGVTHQCQAAGIQGTRDGHLADLDQFRLWDGAWDAPLCVWTRCFPGCRVALDNASAAYVRRAPRRLLRGLDAMTRVDEDAPFLRDHFHRRATEGWEAVVRGEQSRAAFVAWLESFVVQYRRNLGLDGDLYDYTYCG